MRYKCIKGRYNEDSVALYLLEPKTCKYILTIESPSLCDLINGPIDDNGIFIIEPHSDIKNEKISSLKTQFDDDNTGNHFEENVQKIEGSNDEESNDKNKLDKIEL